jgi:hypothetical protein
MKIKMSLLSTLLVCFSLSVSSAANAQEQSIELTNLDLPEAPVDAPPAAAKAPESDGLQVTPQRQSATASAAAKTSTEPALASIVTSTNPALSPMEAYRDLKIQQAATPFAGRPAASRKYLKVDRSTFMESQ